MLQKKPDNTLAIDLGPEAVRVIDVKIRKGQTSINSFTSQSIEAGTPETLPERHLSALASLLTTQRFKTHQCIAAMPTSLVVTRTVALDHNKPQTAEEQIRWTLQNCLPFDAKDLVFDFWPISENLPTARTWEVLVVATQASVVHRYLRGMEKMKLTCAHLDVAPCAMASLIALTAANPDAMIGTVALSENVGFFAITERQRVLFWRPFDLPSAGKGGQNIHAHLDRVGDEISKCVSHMVGSMHIDNMSELLVYGHGSEDVVVTEYLKNRFHLPVRSPSPFETLPPAGMPADVQNALQHSVATGYCTAVGLAIQQSGVIGHG